MKQIKGYTYKNKTSDQVSGTGIFSSRIRVGMLVLTTFIVASLFCLEGCKRTKGTTEDNNQMPTKGHRTVQSKHSTILSLNNNGKAGILKRISGSHAIYLFPEIRLIAETENDGSVVSIKLSSTSQSYAIQTIDSLLEVTTKQKKLTFDIPFGPETLSDWSISNNGAQIACLRILQQSMPEHKAKDNGVLEIWELPFGKNPIASIKTPIFGSGLIAANGDLSRLAIQSTANFGDVGYLRLYQFDKSKFEFKIIFETKEFPLPLTFPKIMNEWIWTTSSEGIIGWNGSERKILPGHMRENIIFSPSGNYLLAYRTEPTNNAASSIKILFRLFNLNDFEVVKQKLYETPAPLKSSFLLDENLQLFEIQLKENETLHATEVGW